MAGKAAKVLVIGSAGQIGSDLTPALRRANTAEAPAYYTFDGHWTPRGHDAVAGAVAGCLKKRGW